MALVTVIDKYVAVDGPRKREVASISSVDDLDTYITTIQRPVFASFVGNTDTNGSQPQVNIGISGRTLTFNSSALSATTGVLTVIGF